MQDLEHITDSLCRLATMVLSNSLYSEVILGAIAVSKAALRTYSTLLHSCSWSELARSETIMLLGQTCLVIYCKRYSPYRTCLPTLAWFCTDCQALLEIHEAIRCFLCRTNPLQDSINLRRLIQELVDRPLYVLWASLILSSLFLLLFYLSYRLTKLEAESKAHAKAVAMTIPSRIVPWRPS